MEVQVYILDTENQARNASEKLGRLIFSVADEDAYTYEDWFKPVQIPSDAPAQFADKWFVKLPYELRNGIEPEDWKALKDKITSMPAYDPARRKKADVSVFRAMMKYDQDPE